MHETALEINGWTKLIEIEEVAIFEKGGQRITIQKDKPEFIFSEGIRFTPELISQLDFMCIHYGWF